MKNKSFTLQHKHVVQMTVFFLHGHQLDIMGVDKELNETKDKLINQFLSLLMLTNNKKTMMVDFE